MHLSAMAYNLKKYLKFITKTVRSDAKTVYHVVLNIKPLMTLKVRHLQAHKFENKQTRLKTKAL
ncbi:hypothetical protein GCM10022396_07040 [Flavivirga amylovorans]